MKEAPQMSSKQIPSFLKRQANNNKGPKDAVPHEMEPPPTAQDKSPPRKKTSRISTLESANVFEAATAAASREINGLFAKFADVLREKADGDTSRMQELEGILTEARNLEAHLKEKKNHLRQTLALISDKLKG